jgi:outer membrane protein
VFSNSYDTDAITLNVTIPLYQSGAEWSRMRAARHLAHQAKFNTMDTQLAVEQDVASAWHNYITAASIITSQEAAAKATQLALDGVRNEQEFGMRTVLDTLNAEQEYMDAQVSLVRAERNHIIQAYRLMASVGKLTSEALSLPVKRYNANENTQRAKYQLIGW